VVRGIRWILALAAAALLLAGCGDGGGAETVQTRTDPQGQTKPPEPAKNLKGVEITLDGYPNAENVGVWMAQERGYFEDAGLDVSIHTPVSPLLPVKYVNDRNVDLAITSEPQVAVAKAKGVPIVAIRSILPRPTAAMIWPRKSKIDGLSDLRGKTIAIPGVPFQEDLLASVLAEAGLTLADVEVEQVEHDLVPALASGRADAIFGGSWNVEGIELDARGLDPVVTRVEDLEIPPYEELVLIARRDRLAKDPKSIRAFTRALARGTVAAIEDPEAAAEVLANQSLKPNRKAIEAQLEATLPLLSKTGRMGAGS
jgi:putative hydroxymethylpyrimidine transport system substrate-binding protein